MKMCETCATKAAVPERAYAPTGAEKWDKFNETARDKWLAADNHEKAAWLSVYCDRIMIDPELCGEQCITATCPCGTKMSMCERCTDVASIITGIYLCNQCSEVFDGNDTSNAWVPLAADKVAEAAMIIHAFTDFKSTGCIGYDIEQLLK